MLWIWLYVQAPFGGPSCLVPCLRFSGHLGKVQLCAPSSTWSFSLCLDFGQSSGWAFLAFSLPKPRDLAASQALKDRHLPLLHAAGFVLLLWALQQCLGHSFFYPTSLSLALSSVFPIAHWTPRLLSFVGKWMEAISRSGVWSLWNYWGEMKDPFFNWSLILCIGSSVPAGMRALWELPFLCPLFPFLLEELLCVRWLSLTYCSSVSSGPLVHLSSCPWLLICLSHRRSHIYPWLLGVPDWECTCIYAWTLSHEEGHVWLWG